MGEYKASEQTGKNYKVKKPNLPGASFTRFLYQTTAIAAPSALHPPLFSHLSTTAPLSSPLYLSPLPTHTSSAKNIDHQTSSQSYEKSNLAEQTCRGYV
ncbi:hypothetical protein AKJ16_DCAP12762 [Drosera capensis]